jgi:hypothetical protein
MPEYALRLFAIVDFHEGVESETVAGLEKRSEKVIVENRGNQEDGVCSCVH